MSQEAPNPNCIGCSTYELLAAIASRIDAGNENNKFLVDKSDEYGDDSTELQVTMFNAELLSNELQGQLEACEGYSSGKRSLLGRRIVQCAVFKHSAKPTN
jgi:hypothetical protein